MQGGGARGEGVCADYKQTPLRGNSHTLRASEAKVSARKDLKVLELRAFNMGFLFKKKGFTLEACTDLTGSMVTVVNSTALKFAKRVGLNSPHDSQNMVTM